ncbi:MAG: hypothetical protein H6718_35175 [Polyangiaceae bacterium]|nr:hypothetical protein [Myxococcales bacterium]MCB9590703.1 hypothetical protein [Polyangiaceae bacterium]
MIELVACSSVVLTPPEGAAEGEAETAPLAKPTQFLKERKSLKYMGLQDQLAVLVAGRALERSNLLGQEFGDRCGLYLAVGYIPFEEPDIAPVLAASMQGSEFSLEKFSKEGYTRAHPLLAFRCLPNMPAYHVAANFGISGPYSVVYPGGGQLYQALEQALDDLQEERVDWALVGGVAHQRNFLVEHHMRRQLPSVGADKLRDAASMLLLRRGTATSRCRLLETQVAYSPFDPLQEVPPATDELSLGDDFRAVWGATEGALEVGPASLGIALSELLAGNGGQLTHRASTREGIRAMSRWELAQ